MKFQKGRVRQKSRLHVADASSSPFQTNFKRESGDDRTFVKKAVNWALRHIGKQNYAFNKMALVTAREIQKLNSRSTRWIAADAIKELTSDVVQHKLRKKSVCR
jgi:3-methyladenine DNA glycosylase AlkD